MERTPSPPRRLHTPPAPIHGAKYDDYEPFSPRRSSRVAAQRDQNEQHLSPTRPRFSRTTRDVTPSSSRKKTTVRASLQGLSPPSSPISPQKHDSPRSTRRTQFLHNVNDSDSDHIAPTPARRFLSTMEPRGMLPTPAKTPRKRPLQTEESLTTTARVLFPSRPATLEEAMPTPRKARKSRKEIFSLDSFGEQMEEEKIEIYTDSKERVPTADEDEDNPFVTTKGKGKAKAKANGNSKARKLDAKTSKMEEAVNRDEGMVYIFRGKKVYRKFNDVPAANNSDGPESSGDELRHLAGFEARRPLTRSAIKPRLLFQAEIKQQRQREMGPDDVDEEAVTDIEVPVATPSKRKARQIVDSTLHHEPTPPPTNPPKREFSFDNWSRVKSSARDSSSSRHGKKRAGETLESSHEKRTRSEPSSSMSLDSF